MLVFALALVGKCVHGFTRAMEPYNRIFRIDKSDIYAVVPVTKRRHVLRNVLIINYIRENSRKSEYRCNVNVRVRTPKEPISL